MAYLVPEESREVLGQCGILCERFRIIAFLGGVWTTDGELWDDVTTLRADVRLRLNRILRGAPS